ncbi:hypothetical protein QBC38DRAFT_354013 [Podospora fimiseda]|uniref:Uncharacterized protein n=1 Tax=Podospora fimiseda TaxID=252190 RepID=A0AAN7BY60_9PEZI|nr:hypothetical protein QBC38DRAFT_354013 [Podospora fimiseda]
MLPRSPFKIRKSTPQKKPDDQEEYQGSYFHHDDDNDEMDTLTKIKTWRPPKGLMKRSKPSIDIRRSEDLHKIICMPPSPYTPQSSTSSLCSIENNGAGFGTSPRNSPPRRPDRSPLEPSPQRSPQRSPLLLPQQIEETQHLQPRGGSPVTVYYFPPQLTPPSSPPQHAEMFPEQSAIRHDVLPDTSSPASSSTSASVPLPATGNEGTQLEPAAEIAPSSKKVTSPDVQKLIQETEEAFKQLPTFAKLSEPQLAKFPLPKQPAPLSPLARRKSSRRSQGSVRSAKSARSVKSPTKAGVTKVPLSPAPPRLPANARPAVRPKRVKSKKTGRRPAAPARQSSMWQLNALTESAREFAIQIGLHKVEVDEMLPESTLREIRMSRAAQWTKSPELGVTHIDNRKDSTATTATTTTPIEPLSLDEVAAEGVATPRASLANKAAEIDRDDAATPKAQGIQLQIPEQKDGSDLDERGQSPVPQPDSPTAGRRNDDDDGEDSLPIMLMADDEPPSRVMSMGPPAAGSASKPPMHRRFPSAPLPTIPEISATTQTTPINVPQTAAPPAPPPPVPVRSDSDEYVYLESTAYTVTVPTFKHGPIRLAKADLPIGKLAAAVDDTLDWTAFQMAILGGAGDFFSEPTDYSRPSEAELDDLDEIYTWFESFGFESAGGLVSAHQRPVKKVMSSPPPPRTPGLSSSGSSINSGGSPPVPFPQRSPGMVRIDPPPARKEPEHLNSLAGRVLAPPPAHKTHRRSVSSGTFSMGEGQPFDSNNTKNFKNLAIDSVKSQQQLRRPSTDSMTSLPQSPMMELVLTHDVHGEEVPVPMGCNMSHDARDFLFWHTEHVISYGPSSGESRAELI